MSEKILVVGYGMIGRRHISLLSKLYSHLRVYVLTKVPDTTAVVPDLTFLRSWDEADQHEFIAALICNPTHLHLQAAAECVKRDIPVFLEKPFSHSLTGVQDLVDLISIKKLPTYVAYCLRFNPVIQYLKKLVQTERPLCVRIINTNHLPSWRPERSSLETYSARLDMGGGVILDLSHEFDFLYHIFGLPENVKVKKGRAGSVTVDAEDFVTVSGKAGLAQFMVHLNYMSHIPRRFIEVDFEDYSLHCDIKNLSVTRYQMREVVEEIRFQGEYSDMYEAQLSYFLDNLHNPEMLNNFAEAYEILKQLIAIRSDD